MGNMLNLQLQRHQLRQLAHHFRGLAEQLKIQIVMDRLIHFLTQQLPLLQPLLRHQWALKHSVAIQIQL